MAASKKRRKRKARAVRAWTWKQDNVLFGGWCRGTKTALLDYGRPFYDAVPVRVEIREVRK